MWRLLHLPLNQLPKQKLRCYSPWREVAWRAGNTLVLSLWQVLRTVPRLPDKHTQLLVAWGLRGCVADAVAHTVRRRLITCTRRVKIQNITKLVKKSILWQSIHMLNQAYFVKVTSYKGTVKICFAKQFYGKLGTVLTGKKSQAHTSTDHVVLSLCFRQPTLYRKIF